MEEKFTIPISTTAAIMYFMEGIDIDSDGRRLGILSSNYWILFYTSLLVYCPKNHRFINW
jgi:hypothetical protein